MSYLYVFLTIALTIYGQLVIKWQVMQVNIAPESMEDKLHFLSVLLSNLWIWSGLLAAFLAALTWMLALAKLQLSHAYPFMSLCFALVLVCSYYFFAEPINIYKILGIGFIMVGVCVSSFG